MSPRPCKEAGRQMWLWSSRQIPMATGFPVRVAGEKQKQTRIATVFPTGTSSLSESVSTSPHHTKREPPSRCPLVFDSHTHRHDGVDDCPSSTVKQEHTQGRVSLATTLESKGSRSYRYRSPSGCRCGSVATTTSEGDLRHLQSLILPRERVVHVSDNGERWLCGLHPPRQHTYSYKGPLTQTTSKLRAEGGPPTPTAQIHFFFLARHTFLVVLVSESSTSAT
jgi:hypothetical protein